MPALRILLAAAIVLSAAPSICSAQQTPQSIATVINTATIGEMYRVDHQTRSATAITIPALLASSDLPNTILMNSPVTGFLGSNPVPAFSTTANVYGFTLIGQNLTLNNNGKALNTTATAGNNLSQIVQVGSELYFTTQNGTTGGVLQSIPASGGPVTSCLDIATVQAAHLANGVAAIGTTVYVSTFLSGALTANPVS